MTKEQNQFKPGHKPWNKNKKGIHLHASTEFKEDQFVGADHPSWKGGVQLPKNDCAHLWDGKGKRVRRPRKIYEEHHGPIPKGFIVIHLDNDPYNDSPDNLKAISRADNLKRNRQ